MNKVIKRTAAVVCEGLEGRRLLSATVVNGVLTVVGSNKSDNISVSVDAADATMLDVSENGVVTQFALAGLTGISMSGGNGNDTMAVDESHGAVMLPVTMSGGNGKDGLTGGSGDDVLDGGNGNDVLVGGAGNDHLLGGNGKDSLDGQDGDDALDGGRGKDHVVGGLGSDHFNAKSDGTKEIADQGVDDVLEGVSGHKSDDVLSA